MRTLGLAAIALAWAANAVAAAPPAAKSQSQASDTNADDEGDTVSELIVKGKRPQPGAVVGDIKPELQMRPAEIQSYGVSTITDLLNELAPELQSDRGRGGEGPVVLLNGRRISSFNEIQNIPTEAILRIDILPEEVSLKYGYAADQRVINIVLRPFFRAWTAEGVGGGPTQGGQSQTQGELDLMRIRRDHRLNLDLKVQDSTAITEDERDLVGANQLPFDPLGNVVAQSGGALQALSALAGQPVSIAGIPATVAPGAPLALSDFATTPNQSDVGAYRTLVAATKSVTANAVYTRPVLGGINATFNATLGATSTDALQGLPTARLLVPAGNPYSPFGEPVEVDRSLTASGPLRQTVDGWTGHLGTTLNQEISKWRLTATATYDHGDSATATDTSPSIGGLQALLNAGAATFNPFAPLDALVSGFGPQSTARSLSDGLAVNFVANGPLFTVPAGDVSATFRMGDTQSWQVSRSDRMGLSQTISLARNDFSGHVNLDVPLTSSDANVLGWAGDLSVNANATFDRLSDFGTLTALGYGLNWSPIDQLEVVISHTRDEAAPTFQQLGAPIVVTPGVQIFDFTTGQTVAVQEVSGGNPGLTSDHRSVTKIGLTLKPMSSQDLTITANYIYSKTINPIETFPAATAQIEAAFPDRFTRDPDGDLEEVDYRPVNFASETREDFRWGINYSRPLGPQPPPRLHRRRPPQNSEANQTGQGTGTPGVDGQGSQDGGSHNGGQDAPNSGSHGDGEGGGGRGSGRGGRARFSGRPTPGRLQFAIYHTVYFKDQMLARPGVPVFDLLNGSPIATGGGQPRQEIQVQAGALLHGFGARLSVNWQSATVVRGDGAEVGDLAFSPLAIANFRLWADLGQQKSLVAQHPILRGARVTLSVTNLFDRRLQVHSDTGATPLIYQPDYLDPLGRVVKLSIRKIFF